MSLCNSSKEPVSSSPSFSSSAETVNRLSSETAKESSPSETAKESSPSETAEKSSSAETDKISSSADTVKRSFSLSLAS